MVRRVGELMSVALEKIYYIAMRKYKMKLIAGKDGLGSNVSWLHIIMLNHIKDKAYEHGCKAIILDSGIPRTVAHKFYEKYGFQKTCFGFEYTGVTNVTIVQH